MNSTFLISPTLFPLSEKEMKQINLKIETILSYQNHIYMVFKTVLESEPLSLMVTFSVIERC